MKKYNYESVGEEIFNSITHGVGALISLTALVFFLIYASTTLEFVSGLIFSISATLLYTMSTVFHALRNGTAKRVFQRFDHISIYVLIAGSYTPFCLLILDREIGIPLFIFQWSLAIVGIVFKSIWIRKFQLVHVAIFLLMGWSVILYAGQLRTNIEPWGFNFILLGGISYSIGVFFYVVRLFKFHHAIWHFFVLFGTIFHYLAVLLYAFN